MSENSQDMYMQWNHTMGASNASIFLIVGLAKGAINLIHFLARMQERRILSGGEVDNFATFLKATKGEYNISRVPLKVDGNEAEDIGNLKQAMDAAGIRYCMLPNFNDAPGEKSCYIAVYEKDQQKFAEVFINHVKNELTGGNKNIDDLKNFTDGRTTVFSIPDETTESMEKAMEKFQINYSMITADITPHHTQYLIPNSQLQRLQFIYKTFQEDMKKDGKPVGDSKVFESAEEYAGKAKMTNEEYVKSQMKDSKVSEAMEPLKHEATAEETALKNEMNKVGDSESIACGRYFRNENYMPLSIDDGSLVHNPKDRVLFDIQMNNPEVFACRVPGTFGTSEEILLIPPEQVFKVEDAERPRYIAFLRRDEAPAVVGASGREITRYKDAESLYQSFDKEGKRPSYNPQRLSEISKEEIKGGWEGIEPEKGRSKPLRSGNGGNFKQRDYDFDAIEAEMLRRSGYDISLSKDQEESLAKMGLKTAEAPEASGIEEAGEEIVNDIANSIPTKSLGL